MIGIYKILNLVNNKVYVGQTINYTNRVYLHTHYLENNCHCNSHLQNAWNKYGSENFKFELIEDFSDTDYEKVLLDKILDEHEIFWIKFYKASNPDFGYNLSEGGDGATLFGDRNPTFGKPRTDDVKRKISQTKKKNNSAKGKNNPMYGKHHTLDTRQKISKANKGRIQSKEEIDKRAATMRKLLETEEFKNKRKEGAVKAGLKKRKYEDCMVLYLREQHENGLSIKQLSKKYNIPFESCRIMVKGKGRFANIK